MTLEIVDYFLTTQGGTPNPDYVEINLAPTRTYVFHHPTGMIHHYVGSDHINRRITGRKIEGKAKTKILVEALLKMIEAQLLTNRLQT